MKSLLVDALREAQNNADANQPRRTEAESIAEDPAAQAELQILAAETGVALFAPEALSPEDDDVDHTMLLPVLGADDIRGHADGGDDPLGATGWLTTAGADLNNPSGGIALIGRWSPALCVASMLLVAGAYAFVQNLTGGQLNSDLSNVSQQVSQTTARHDAPVARPDGTSPFRFDGGDNGNTTTSSADDDDADAQESATTESDPG